MPKAKSCAPPSEQPANAETLVLREPAGGGSSGDFFVVYRAQRRIQALDCQAEDGGLSCIERIGPALRRAVVPYRVVDGRIEGALDHLAGAGRPPCESFTLPAATQVYDLPSRRVSYSRVEAGTISAGHGEPIGQLEADTIVQTIEAATDSDGQSWLEIRAPVAGWIPMACPTE